MKYYRVRFIQNTENPKDNIYAVSLVDEPANQSDFIYMSEEKESNMEMFLTNEEKGQIVGPVLIPKKPFYRSQLGGMCFFEEEDIRDAFYDFMKKGKAEFTLSHMSKTSDVTLLEAWIVEDEVHDKQKIYDMNYPIGTLMFRCKLETEDLRKKVKDGKFNGFSIESFFDVHQAEFKMKEEVDKDFVIEAIYNQVKQDPIQILALNSYLDNV